MNDLIISLYKYFVKFVPKEVLRRMFIQPRESIKTGYEEIKAELLGTPDTNVIQEFDTFVVSINENYISERIKNANKFILFVEYGALSVNYDTLKGVKQHLAITVAYNFSNNNNDNLNEIILMNQCLALLEKIIITMQSEQDALDFCANSELISDPVEIRVVDPVKFHGCAGWVAMFKNANTIFHEN
ncbi:hypothetical protein D0T49_01900 [Paludibacter sp. 221]|uniref:hypothetical protein n=1 Tax=Paludibacter sp. 221 TaxID=2302939 RepID=UPI0013D231E8|nr:hypothetical protein [Paludibacter sp. 221]NDV45803.1 hypothetical protein [Paludibacter sp. 221]